MPKPVLVIVVLGAAAWITLDKVNRAITDAVNGVWRT